MNEQIFNLLMIGLGGGLGAISRYSLGGYIQKILAEHNFPYGTLAVNIVGCFLIGVIGGLVDTKDLLHPMTRSLVLIGFLGGFTTFSTFGYDTLKLLQNGQLIGAAGNVFISVGFGLLAVITGLYLVKMF